MANTPREVVAKIGSNGSRTPQNIARQLNQNVGKPSDIAHTKTPLQESGTVLPSVKKGKK